MRTRKSSTLIEICNRILQISKFFLFNKSSWRNGELHYSSRQEVEGTHTHKDLSYYYIICSILFFEEEVENFLLLKSHYEDIFVYEDT